MKCKKCQGVAIISKPNLCEDHFVNYFENKIFNTIKKYKLIKSKDKIVVAVSGGKDSLTVLNVLTKYCNRRNIDALSIDEGIKGYREKTLVVLKQFCKERKINLNIIKFKTEYGRSLDEILSKHKKKPCTVCGIFRRDLLNKYSQKYDLIATGHNMDDTAQAIVMNLLKNNIALLARQGPISGIKKQDRLTKRIKPLYFCTEKEVMTYSVLKNLTTEFSECPNVSESFRLKVRDQLNIQESKYPGTKEKIIKWYISKYEYIKRLFLSETADLNHCTKCEQPTSNIICGTCRMKNEVFSQKEMLKMI